MSRGFNLLHQTTMFMMTMWTLRCTFMLDFEHLVKAETLAWFLSGVFWRLPGEQTMWRCLRFFSLRLDHILFRWLLVSPHIQMFLHLKPPSFLQHLGGWKEASPAVSAFNREEFTQLCAFMKERIIRTVLINGFCHFKPKWQMFACSRFLKV